MGTFEYRGFDSGGRVRKGLVEALSVKDAREKLASDGILTERLSRTGRQVRFSANVRALVYSELSALLRAGLPLVQAMDFLIKSPDLSGVRALLAGVRDRVAEGASLAESLSSASSSVSTFERAVIEVAERSATVDILLDRLAAFIEEQEELRERIRTALIYPAFVVGLGICSAVLMLGIFVPMVVKTLTGGNLTLPLLTRYAIGVGHALGHWGTFLTLLLMAGFICYLWRKRRTNPEFARTWDQWLFRLPWVGKGYSLTVNLRFAKTMAILLRSGVSAIEGLMMAGRATGSPWIAYLAEKEAESVRHGGKLSEAVQRIPPLASSMPSWIRTGEASGGIPSLLDGASGRYQNQLSRYVTRSLTMAELLLILLVGGFVLLIALAVLLPVFSLSQGIKTI